MAFCTAPIALVWGILAAIADPNGRRAVSITLAFDTLGNAAIGGNRMQTISAATGIQAAKGKWWARCAVRVPELDAAQPLCECRRLVGKAQAGGRCVKSLGTTIAAALAAGTANLCTIWQIARLDGVIEYWTDHDEDIEWNGQTWLSDDSYTRSQQLARADMSVMTLEMDTGARTGLDMPDIDAGTYDGAAITLWTLDWSAASYEPVELAYGRIGNITIEESGQVKFEFRSLAQQLQIRIGRTIGPACDADTGDARCGVNLADFTVTGTATAGTTDSVTDSARTEADGYFTGGSITPSSGQNAGLEREVQDYTAGVFSVYEPWPYPVAVGDTYSAVAGDDKTFATCTNKFKNGARFRGFPDVPGADAALAGK